MALLQKRDAPYDETEPPYNVQPWPPPSNRKNKYHGQSSTRAKFSFQVLFTNKLVVVDAVRRSVIRRKFSHGVEMIVTRGAKSEHLVREGEYGEAISQGHKVVFNDADVGEEKWLIPGTSTLSI